MNREQQYEHGLAVLRQIDGEAGQRVVDSLADISPELGLTPAQITAALLHSAVYCGMPRALNATFVARKVFSERDLLPVDNTTT
jgi:4-carboxymuconolactone decarboxylase